MRLRLGLRPQAVHRPRRRTGRRSRRFPPRLFGPPVEDIGEIVVLILRSLLRHFGRFIGLQRVYDVTAGGGDGGLALFRRCLRFGGGAGDGRGFFLVIASRFVFVLLGDDGADALQLRSDAVGRGGACGGQLFDTSASCASSSKWSAAAFVAAKKASASLVSSASAAGAGLGQARALRQARVLQRSLRSGVPVWRALPRRRCRRSRP